MNIVIKRVLTAVALVAVCVLILLAIKSYGVWVISGIAVVLAIVGLLRREAPPAAKAEPGEAGAPPPSAPGEGGGQGD